MPRASSFTGDSWKFRNNASLMVQGSSYCTTCISIVRLNFPKRCEYRKCGTVWCYYNIVTWCNPKNIWVHALYVQKMETYVLSLKQDTAVHIHPKQYKRGTCLHFIYWNLYCPHVLIVFWGEASIAPSLLQATIPNTVIPAARTQPISSMFVVSNLTTVPKAAPHNPKSY